MAKVRVHELAKQLGMESKEVLAKLQEMGEFVRSASSTIDRKSTRLNSSHIPLSRMPSSA